MTRSRSGGCLRALVVGLVVLLGLTVGLDRAAAYGVERVAGQRLREQLSLAADPGVRVQGFPFLNQVAGRRLDRIDVDARDLPLRSNRPGRAAQVTAEFEGLGLDADFTPVSAASLSAEALVEWPEASQLLGHPMRYAGRRDGRGVVEVDSEAKLGGQHVGFKVTAVPQIDEQNQSLTLVDAEVDLSGYQLPAAAVKDLTAAATRPVPLAIAPGVKVTQVRADEAGLHISLRGHDVPLTR